MREILNASEKIKKLQRYYTRLMVKLELTRNKVPKETLNTYENLFEDINTVLTNIREIASSIEPEVIKVNNLLEGLPEDMRNILFNPAGDEKS